MKRYVGGLGASAFNCLHIGQVGFRPDDLGESFTVLRLLLFRQLKHRTEKTHIDCKQLMWADVRRFDVKDSSSELST
jgi:hypothetical protein